MTLTLDHMIAILVPLVATLSAGVIALIKHIDGRFRLSEAETARRLDALDKRLEEELKTWSAPVMDKLELRILELQATAKEHNTLFAYRLEQLEFHMSILGRALEERYGVMIGTKIKSTKNYEQ